MLVMPSQRGEMKPQGFGEASNVEIIIHSRPKFRAEAKVLEKEGRKERLWGLSSLRWVVVGTSSGSSSKWE